MRQDEKAIFKFNNGNGALLCSKCRVIIKTGRDFTEEEIMAIKGKLDMPPQYCKQCKTNNMDAKTKAAYLVVKYMSKVVSQRVAIECALVAVDEILKAVNNPDETYLMKYSVEYWSEVKSEIEKL